MLKRLVLPLIALFTLFVPAQAAPEKDLAEWTEEDIQNVNPSLRDALRRRVEGAKLQAAEDGDTPYRNAEQRLADRLAPFGNLCTEGEDCGGAAAAPAVAVSSGRSGADVYGRHCFACHSTGLAGAPKLGDADEWAPRLDKGMDTLMSNTVNGFANNTMPPMGTCMDCSDAELQAAIDHLIAGE